MIETKLTDKVMYHITSCLFVMCLAGLLIVKIIAYIRLDLLSPTMQFIFFLLAIWSFFEAIKRYQRMNIDRKLDIE